MVLDDAKVAEAARWDGLHGVYTSHATATLKGDAVLNLYRGLWQVEATFRVTKHDLAVRPIYHWKLQRIAAHVAIAFMILTQVRMLSYRAKLQQHVAMSEERIRLALAQTQVASMHDKFSYGRYALPMKQTADAKRLYKLMDLPYDAEPYAMD